MKKAWLSAILNFFFMGLGYVYNGKRILLGVLLTLAAIGLTYVENFHVFADGNALQAHDSKAFMILFACVFVANAGLAIDAYKEAQNINAHNSAT
ncbi:MAG: hypothetical protein AB8F95_09125 [Bacteroidia bacterium]